MIIEIGGFIVVSVVMAGIAVVATKGAAGKKPKRDLLSDYMAIKSALVKYRKDHAGLVQDIEVLMPYVESGVNIDWKHYRLSLDEKFLVSNTIGILEPESIVNRVGGDSYMLGESVYLSFSTLQMKKDDGEFEPVAAFKVFPEHINTMTNVLYDTAECRAVDGEIVEYKWEKALQNFDIPGDYVIKLKIKDKNGKWSKTAEKKIKVVREEGLSQVVAGGTSLFVVHKDGKVDGQGSNGYGQLGTGNINPYRDREIIPMLHSVVGMSATDTHTLVRKINGTVYAFGKNEFGQLGTGTKGDLKVPKEIWGLKNVTQVATGENFSGALDAYGKVYTWGDNQHGQLGGDRSGSREMPMQLEELSEIKYISLGYNFGMAVRQDGTVYAWGDNQYGQLGLGFKSKQSDIMMTTLKGIEKVVCGRNFALAIDTKGEVLGWGANTKNQLGLIGHTEVLFPAEIHGLKKIVDIKTYGNYSIALDSLGKIYLWGQTNVLNDNYPEKPKCLDFLPLAISIAAADRYSYLLTADGRVIRWSGDTNNAEELTLKSMQNSIDLEG